MGMHEEFHNARYLEDADGSLGEQSEPFYIYLSGEVKRRGVDAINEMELCILDTDGRWGSVHLAMVWCGDDTNQDTMARRLSTVLRVLRDHPDPLARISAVNALYVMRPDLLDGVCTYESDPHVRFHIAKTTIDSEMRGIIPSDMKYIMAAKHLLGSVYHRRNHTGDRNQSVRKTGLADAVQIFGAPKTAIILHFMYYHRFTTDETRQIMSSIMMECASPELLAAFRVRDVDA